MLQAHATEFVVKIIGGQVTDKFKRVIYAHKKNEQREIILWDVCGLQQSSQYFLASTSLAVGSDGEKHYSASRWEDPATNAKPEGGKPTEYSV